MTGEIAEWLLYIAEKVARLPWHETFLPDGRTLPEPRGAVGLIAPFSYGVLDCLNNAWVD